MSNETTFLSPPHLGSEELRFVHEAFESNYIAPLGPQVNAFEEEFSDYVGLKHCVALSSGTGAMHLALRDIGVGPGDEVLASSLTFIGNVSPVTFLGGVPVFIDSDRESWNMDPDLLSEALAACEKRGSLPKAAIPTDLYGQCADYDRIVEICDGYNVPVVIDAAESLGAEYQRAETDSGQRSEVRGRQKTEIKGQRSEIGDRPPAHRGLRPVGSRGVPEIGCRRSEIGRRQKAAVRGQKSEGRAQKSETRDRERAMDNG